MAKLLDENGLSYFWGKFKSRLLPSGGSSGQVLAKSSATNYDVTWVDQSGGSVSMEDTEVDAAVEAAWPAPAGYAITPVEGYVEMGHLLAIGLSDSVEQGEFVATAGEGETVYVMGVGHWEPNVTIDSTGTSVSWNFYSSSQNIKLYTFTMPAEAVTVAMTYND